MAVQQNPSYAIRLTFTYQGRELVLDSRERVEMRLPPSHAVIAPGAASGFWFELQDASGRTLYRRVTESPVHPSVEVRTDDPASPITRMPVDRPQERFVLLVPDLPTTGDLVLFASPLDTEGTEKPAEEMARFDLSGPGPVL